MFSISRDAGVIGEFSCRISGYFDVLEERGDSARDRKKVETYVGGVILRFLQIIACNGIEIMETNLLHNVQVLIKHSVHFLRYRK